MASVAAIDSSFITIYPIVNQADQHNSEVTIRLQPPDDSLIALNAYGSVVEHVTKTACGGVMRDCNGNFLVAYLVCIHPCSVLEVELWDIYYGLRLCGVVDSLELKLYLIRQVLLICSKIDAKTPPTYFSGKYSPNPSQLRFGRLES